MSINSQNSAATLCLNESAFPHFCLSCKWFSAGNCAPFASALQSFAPKRWHTLSGRPEGKLERTLTLRFALLANDDVYQSMRQEQQTIIQHWSSAALAYQLLTAIRI